VSVYGTMHWREIAAFGPSYQQTGIEHTCGITMEGRTLCWGSNLDGALGSGTNGDGVAGNRSIPQPVLGQQ